jgi:serine/threonine-protein kinase
MIIKHRLVPPREHMPSISEPLEKVILKALTKDRDERYQSAELFAQDLERAVEGDA